MEVELGVSRPLFRRRRPRGDEVRDFDGVADGADVVAENGTPVRYAARISITVCVNSSAVRFSRVFPIEEELVFTSGQAKTPAQN